MTGFPDVLRQLQGTALHYFSVPDAAVALGLDPSHIPYSTRTLVEGVLRRQRNPHVAPAHLEALLRAEPDTTIPYFPGRILMQDASGIPVLADLLTFRERGLADGRDPVELEPALPMDLVVDHALEVDEAGSARSAMLNLDIEYERHQDRYTFLAQVQRQLSTLRVIPPGIGICHQLNLEVLATLVREETVEGRSVAALDTLVGTDSHTTMINGLGVTGWGVGGIEATAALLGQPLMISNPRVVGVRLTGSLPPGVFAADLALHLAYALRRHDVVGAIVEFHGPGMSSLTLPDRATVANMAPEYGATMAYFPPDETTLDYLSETGRPRRTVDLARTYLRAQGLLLQPHAPTPQYSEVLTIALNDLTRTLSGPSHPHDILSPHDIPASLVVKDHRAEPAPPPNGAVVDGDIAIAAITSCTNTSNPRALVAAGLLARNAVQAGLTVPDRVKSSFTPGSRSASDLLEAAGLQASLDRLGFSIAGFGCGTCMGNSGPLPPEMSVAARDRGIALAAVLSGNRNFAGRIHPDVANSYLASPAMVVAYALLGHIREDIDLADLAHGGQDQAVLLHQIWPSEQQINYVLAEHGRDALKQSATRPLTTTRWQQLQRQTDTPVTWQDKTGNIRRPPFAGPALTRPAIDGDILDARALLVLGDAVTTDHISPVSRILPDSAAGRWLRDRGVGVSDLGTFSSRRLNHDVMMRGGFANPRLQNQLCPGEPGGVTVLPGSSPVPIHVAARTLQEQGIAAVVIAGKLYGAGSARDWAAKVTRLFGVRAVIAQSFERIHRTNLIAFGVLPIECTALENLIWDGSERIDILGLATPLGVHQTVTIKVHSARKTHELGGRCRIDTPLEAEWLAAGGVMAHLLNSPSPGTNAGAGVTSSPARPAG